jgi:cyclophilin family peptidyl-prolyl cis-trans isomerase
MYESDFDWSSRGPIVLRVPQTRMRFHLYTAQAPLACENFLALCTGEKGKSSVSSKPLHYKGARFHRIVEGFVAQGGDTVFGNGSGGDSIWGKKFKDDTKGLSIKLDRKGLLAMCNTGKNSNGSQVNSNYHYHCGVTNGQRFILDGVIVLFHTCTCTQIKWKTCNIFVIVIVAASKSFVMISF